MDARRDLLSDYKLPFRKKVILVLIWCVIALAFPFAISQAYNLPYSLLIPSFSGCLIFVIFFFNDSKKVALNTTIVVVFIAQISVGILWGVIHGAVGYINLVFQYFVTFILYYAILYVRPIYFLKSFRTFLLTMSVLSAVTFLLCLLIKLPYITEFPNQDGRLNYNFVIAFSNTVYDLGVFRLTRPSGFFDEPGSLAFYLVVLLIINELVFRSKNTTVLIILTGITTLSVAFYFIVVIYFFLVGGRRLFRLFKLVPLALGLFFGLFMFVPEDVRMLIEKFTVDRIESLVHESDDEAGYNKGNNRAELIKTAISAIYDSPIIGQGLSYAADPSSKYFGKFMGANIFGVFGINGIIGGIFFSLHILYFFFVCFFKYSSHIGYLPKKMFLLYFILILQRPDYIGGLLTYVSVLALIFSVSIYFQNYTVKDETR